MNLQTAVHLIEDGIEKSSNKQVWADLGAGDGLFTHALSTLLSNDSTIYAVDKDGSLLNSIHVRTLVILKKYRCDFVNDSWAIEPLSGVLMANSLHFVKDQEIFLTQIKKKLSHSGRLIIVEYEMEQSNSWVPYPIGFSQLSDLINRCGFRLLRKLREVPSVYDKRMIYSVVIE